MTTIQKIITLWIITVIGMILHFNYHVGDLFYGIDITVPDAIGVVPNSAHLMRGVFYHLPILWIIIALYIQHKLMRITLFIISFGYTIAHAMHFFGELTNEVKDVSQLSLLGIVLVVSFLLNYEHYRYFTVK